MAQILLVGLGGFFGAIGRYLLSGWAMRVGSESATLAGFPLGTLVVNVVGSFLLGLLLAGGGRGGVVSQEAQLLLGVGALGAFTTFSTFSVETLALLRDGAPLAALASVGANVVGGLGAAALGLVVGLWLFGAGAVRA